jgi:LPS-assembly protein
MKSGVMGRVKALLRSLCLVLLLWVGVGFVLSLPSSTRARLAGLQGDLPFAGSQPFSFYRTWLPDAKQTYQARDMLPSWITAKAQRIEYDLRRDLAVLKGKVVICAPLAQNQAGPCARLWADQVIYAQERDHLWVRGPATFSDGQGTFAHCQDIQGEPSLRHMVVKQAHIESPDHEHLSVKAFETSPQGQIFEEAVYTPCRLCPDRLPLWAVGARRIEHDCEKDLVVFDRASLLVRGQAITPPISFFLPTKRRSGLLIPTAGQSKELGFYGGVPVYWVVAPSRDLTLTPLMTGRGGGLLAGHYRQALVRSGMISVRGAINQATSQTLRQRWKAQQATRQAQRGYGQLDAEIPLGPFFRLKSQEIWVSDPTFFATRPFFGHVQSPYLHAWTALEGFSRQHYLRLRGMRWQGLQEQDRAGQMPRVYPDAAYLYTTPAHSLGQVRFSAQSLSLYRSQGPGMQRQNLALKGESQCTTSWGQRIVAFGHGQHTNYQTSDQHRREGKLSRQGPGAARAGSHHFSRPFGQMGLESELPLMLGPAHCQAGLKPKVQVMYASKPRRKNNPIPNEDSRAVLFDSGCLFARQRFSGIDRVETGSRATYGLQVDGLQGQALEARLFVGQNYSFSHTSPLLQLAGVRKGPSDLVSQVELDWRRISALYSTQYNTRGRSWRSHEVSVLVDFHPIRLETGYFLARAPLVSARQWLAVKQAYDPWGKAGEHPFGQDLGQDADPWDKAAQGQDGGSWSCLLDHDSRKKPMQHQLNVALSAQLTEVWSSRCFLIRDLRSQSFKGRMLSQGVGLSYQDECFAAGATLQRLAFRLHDLQPGYSVTFFVALKNLGGIQQTQQRFFKPEGQGLFSGTSSTDQGVGQ